MVQVDRGCPRSDLLITKGVLFSTLPGVPTHIPILLASPGFLLERITIEVHLPATVKNIEDAIRQAAPEAITEGRDLLIPTHPQLELGSASFLVVPSWFTAAKMVPVLIDARAHGGGVFATVVPYPTDVEGIRRATGFSSVGSCEFFVSGCFTRIEQSDSVELPEGALIKLLPPQSVPLWAPILVFSLWHPQLWETTSESVTTGPGQCIQLLHSSGKYLLSYREEDQWRNLNRIAQLVGIQLAAARVVYADPNAYSPYVHKGTPVCGVAAVFPRTTEKDEAGHALPYVIFLDARLIGAGFEFLALSRSYVTHAEISNSIPVPPLPGWTLAVSGGTHSDRGIEIEHGDVLTLKLFRQVPLEENSESEPDFSDDPEEDDGSNEGHDSETDSSTRSRSPREPSKDPDPSSDHSYQPQLSPSPSQTKQLGTSSDDTCCYSPALPVSAPLRQVEAYPSMQGDLPSKVWFEPDPPAFLKGFRHLLQAACTISSMDWSEASLSDPFPSLRRLWGTLLPSHPSHMPCLTCKTPSTGTTALAEAVAVLEAQQLTAHIPAPLHRIGDYPPRDDQHEDAVVDQGDDAEEVQVSSTWTATFMVFIFDSTPVTVQVTLSTPCVAAQALQAVSEMFPPERGQFYTRFIHADPQPSEAWGAAIALPPWSRREPLVLLNMTAMDGRCFLVAIASPFHKGHVLKAAGLSETADVDIFVYRSHMPMAPGEVYEVQEGGLITVKQAGGPFIVQGFSLHAMLANPLRWDAEPSLPTPPAGENACVVQDSTYGFVTLPSGVFSLREHVLDAYRQDPRHAHFVCGYPALQDLSCSGFPCGRLCALTQDIPDHTPAGSAPCISFLDCRPLLMGWTLWVSATNVVPHQDLADVFSTFAPTDWKPHFIGVEQVAEALHCYNGCVLVATFVHDPQPVFSPSQASATLPGHESDNETEDQETSSLADESAEPAACGSERGSSGSSSNRETRDSPQRSRSPRRRNLMPLGRQEQLLAPVPCFRLHSLVSLIPLLLVLVARGLLAHQVLPLLVLWATQAHASTVRPVFTIPVLPPPPSCHEGDSVLCLTVLLAVSTMVCCWWLRHAANFIRSCKVLREPASSGPPHDQRLHELRLITTRLGLPWLTLFDSWLDPHPLDIAEEPMTDLQESSLVRIPFAVLVPDYAPELLEAPLSLPATLHEATEVLKDLREEEPQDRHPHLLSVLPQPVHGYATFVALPLWNPTALVICLNTSQIDSRVFASYAPDYTNQAGLIALAGLPPSLPYDVYLGIDAEPLRRDLDIHLYPGLQVLFLHPGSTPPRRRALQEALLNEDLWQGSAPYPAPLIQSAYCLVDAQCHRLHVTDYSLPFHFRRHIADTMGLSSVDFSLTPAVPPLNDVAIGGVTCHAVIAIGDASRRDEVAIILDCRAIREGFRAMHVPFARLALSHLLDTLQDEAPPHWFPIVIAQPNDQGIVDVEPGQVIQVRYHMAAMTWGREASSNPLPADGSVPPSGASDQDPQPSVSGPPEPMPNQQEVEEGPGTSVPTPPDQACQVGATDQLIALVVLVPAYKPEVHAMPVTFPATLLLVIAALSAVRGDDQWLHFPTLIPISPQPDMDRAYFVARPHFPSVTITAAFDTRLVDGRLFAMSMPPMATRSSILAAAQLEHRAFLQVYHKDLPWPLPDDHVVYLTDGDLLCVSPVDTTLTILVDLEDRLQDPTGWIAPSQPVTECTETLWLQALSMQFWLPIVRGDQHHLCVEAAARLGATADELTVVPATPPILDFEFRGWPVANLLAIDMLSEPFQPPSAQSAQNVIFFIDKRALLLDIIWAVAENGIADLTAVFTALTARCPPGYLVRIRGGITLPSGSRRVLAGEVLVAELLQANIHVGHQDAPNQGGNPGSNSGSGPSPSNTHHPQAGSDTDPPTHPSAADTGGTRSHQAPGPSYQLAPGTVASLEDGCIPKNPGASPVFRLSAWLGLGTMLLLSWSTQPVQALGCCIFLAAANRSRRATCVLSILVLLCMQVVATSATKTDPIGTQPPFRGIDTSGSTATAVPNLMPPRPLPTPCRSGAGVPATRPLDLGAACSYTTLLEQSCRDAGGKPIYDACTLLEVLAEHFSSRARNGLASKALTKVAKPTLQLQRLLPDHDRRATLSLPLAIPDGHPFEWPVLPARIAPGDQATIGCTSLGFTFEQLQRFLASPTPLLTWAQTFALLPNFHREADRAWEVFCHDLKLRSRPGDIWAFTDGSFTPARDHAPARAGWAAVFIDPAANTFATTMGPVSAFPDEAVVLSAYVAECQALTAAGLVSVTSYSRNRVHFVSDCQAAIEAAAGRCGYQLQGIPHTLASVHTFRKQVCNGHDLYAHVAGHAGILGNEIADRASKLGATFETPFRGLLTQSEDEFFWLGQGAAKLPWAALAINSLRGHSTLPPLNSTDVGNNQNHGGLTQTQLLEPFLPPGTLTQDDEPRADDSLTVFCLRFTAVTFNVLSLGERKDAPPGQEVTEGLAFKPARTALLAEQLNQHGATVAFLQETRAETSSAKVGGFIRFTAGAHRGQHGTEIWFAKGSPFLQAQSPSQSSDTFEDKSFVVIHQDPRRLFVRYTGQRISVLFVSLHGPHRATEVAIIDSWWQHTEQLLYQHVRQSHVVLGGDMNASIGSVPSKHVGPVAMEEEDTAGEYLHRLAKRYDLCFPATLDHVHEGPSFTYVQKHPGQLCRPDMIAIPLDWLKGEVFSCTVPEIHAAHSTPDHVAASVALSTRFCAPAVRKPPSRRLLAAAAISHEANRAAIEQIFHSAPPVDWHVSVHAHAAILTRHVQTGHERVLKSAGRKPHHPYLSDEAWDLQGKVAHLRRALHRLTDVLSRSDLASGFYAWRQQKPLIAVLAPGRVWLLKAQRVKFCLHRDLRMLCKNLRKICRRDRDVHITELAHTIATQPSKEAFAAYHRILAHRRKKAFRLEPLPGILQADGELCADTSAMQQRWRQHFAGLEAGIDTDFATLVHKTQGPVPEYTFDHPTDISEVPSLPLLRRVLCLC